MTYFATKPRDFYIAACVDGLTSCMLSQSQAYITDHQRESSNLSVELSKFQGFAIGMAFMIGIPLGAVLSSRFSIRTPIQIAVGLCALNCALIPLFLPQAPVVKEHGEVSFVCSSEINTFPFNNSAEDTVGDKKYTKKTINWKAANPLGAAVMLTRTSKLLTGSIAYLLLNIAHCGVQVTWINYLQYKFGMSQALSGSTLMVVGIIVATLPPFIM